MTFGPAGLFQSLKVEPKNFTLSAYPIFSTWMTLIFAHQLGEPSYHDACFSMFASLYAFDTVTVLEYDRINAEKHPNNL